ALFQLKYTLAEAKNTPGRTKNLIVGIVASIYSVYLIYAGGFNYLLLTMIAYALGMLLYIKMRRDDKQEVFTGYEKWA
ncbi:arginine-ornithine antiporter, partial [Streptococcus suis]